MNDLWKDQPTPLTDAQRPQNMGVNRNYTRQLEQRMRAAEALLYQAAYGQFGSTMSWIKEAKAHLAAAQAMDENTQAEGRS